MTYTWNLKDKTKEHIIKQKQLQIQIRNKWLPEGRGADGEIGERD